MVIQMKIILLSQSKIHETHNQFRKLLKLQVLNIKWNVLEKYKTIRNKTAF